MKKLPSILPLVDFGAKVELAAASFLETGKLLQFRLNARAWRVWRVKGAAESTNSLET
jgi:hypothetical protein